jgi:hypothetical protein
MNVGLITIIREADKANEQAERLADAAHLPGEWPEALEFYRQLIASYNDAMLAGDVLGEKKLFDEAKRLAYKLNGGDVGIFAHDDAPGYRLMRETAAPKGKVPLWGQQGEFYVRHRGVLIRIEVAGMMGIGGSGSFNAHAVKRNKPFISDTGFRSFLGFGTTGGTVLDHVSNRIEDHICNELKGRLQTIKPIERHHGTAA